PSVMVPSPLSVYESGLPACRAPSSLATYESVWPVAGNACAAQPLVSKPQPAVQFNVPEAYPRPAHVCPPRSAPSHWSLPSLTPLPHVVPHWMLMTLSLFGPSSSALTASRPTTASAFFIGSAAGGASACIEGLTRLSHSMARGYW